MSEPDPTAGSPARCLNCDAPLAGPYCASCGQRTPHANPTLREFVRETTHELTNWEGKLPATLKALMLKPGLLTEDFIAGRRARWLPPLRVYIICSVAYFLSGPIVARLTGEAERTVTRISATNPGATGGAAGDAALTPEARRALEDAGAVRLVGRERFDRMAADLNELNTRVGGTVTDAMPKVMFALMPMFALLTWLAWRDEGRRFPAHLYFSLHLHAAWFAAMVVAQLAALTRSVAAEVLVALLVVAYTTWYSIVAFKRVLGGTSTQMFVRSTVVGVTYGIWMLTAVFAATAYALLTY